MKHKLSMKLDAFSQNISYLKLGFLFQGVLDRFKQISPKIMFSVDAVRYNNKIHDHLQKLTQVVQNLTELEKVIVLPFVGRADEIELSGIPKR